MADILIKAGSYIAIILLGIVLRRVGFFKKEDFNVLVKIVIRITLPAAIIVSTDNNEITSFEDLEGKKTANTISSTYAAIAESYGAEVTGVDDLNQTFELLFTGRIDATLNAEVSYYDYMKAHPDAQIKIAALSDTATEIAIPMQKGDHTATLRAAIDQALQELHESGKLSELSMKYFGLDITTNG